MPDQFANLPNVVSWRRLTLISGPGEILCAGKDAVAGFLSAGKGSPLIVDWLSLAHSMRPSA